jgi:hypothetical protein
LRPVIPANSILQERPAAISPSRNSWKLRGVNLPSWPLFSVRTLSRSMSMSTRMSLRLALMTMLRLADRHARNLTGEPSPSLDRLPEEGVSGPRLEGVQDAKMPYGAEEEGDGEDDEEADLDLLPRALEISFEFRRLKGEM